MKVCLPKIFISFDDESSAKWQLSGKSIEKPYAQVLEILEAAALWLVLDESIDGV